MFRERVEIGQKENVLVTKLLRQSRSVTPFSRRHAAWRCLSLTVLSFTPILPFVVLVHVAGSVS